MTGATTSGKSCSMAAGSSPAGAVGSSCSRWGWRACCGGVRGSGLTARTRRFNKEHAGPCFGQLPATLERAARGTDNVLPHVLDAVKVYATVGEIANTCAACGASTPRRS
jgi:hypothetical protein